MLFACAPQDWPPQALPAILPLPLPLPFPATAAAAALPPRETVAVLQAGRTPATAAAAALPPHPLC